MPIENKNGLDLRDPAIVAKLENVVFNGLEDPKLPAKLWLASMALLLVSKQDENQAIQMDINGIRVEFNLLPPAEDSPYRDRSGEEGE